MATLAHSAVAYYPAAPNISDAVYEIVTRPELTVMSLKLTLTGQGGLTNTITAHALGFEKLVFATGLFDATNSKGYPTVIDPVNNLLVLVDGSAAPAPVDVTSSAAYVTIVGILRISASLT